MKKPKDTEIKNLWLSYGEEKEHYFVNEIAPKLSLDAKINPKKKYNPTAIDLIINGKLTDLKTQETPFFTSLKRSNIPPQWCVTFNVNDYKRYLKYNKSIIIMFWIRWVGQLERYGQSVDKMKGIWSISFDKIKRMVEKNRVTRHYYKRRTSDKENSQDSYLLDLRNMNKIIMLKIKEK